MNKNWFAAFMAAMCSGMLQSVCAAGVPLPVKNSSFELGGDGWNLPPTGWKVEAGAGRNGSRALVFDGTDLVSSRRPGQYLDVKPGKRYRMSAWLRAENLKCKNPHNGITVFIEWFDAAGKFRDNTSMKAVQGNGGWVRHEVITPKVREGLVKCRLMPIMRLPISGRGIIDDIHMEEIVQEAVSGVWSGAYRDQAVSGEVEFAAGLNLPDGVTPESARAVFSFAGSGGGTVDIAGKITGKDEARALIDVGKMAAGTNDVVCTLYSGAKKLGSGKLSFVRLAKPVRRRVYYDRHHRMIVDGKPYLPLGLYCYHLSEKDLAAIAKTPFNCVMPYKFRYSDREFDMLDRSGIRLICDVRKNIDISRDDSAGRDWLKKTIPRVRQEPSVLMWYSDDESALVNVPRLRSRYRLIRDLGQDYPVWAVQCKWGQMGDYLGSFDCFGMDPYPVSSGPVGSVTGVMRMDRKSTFGLKPMLHVLQGFRWNEGSRVNERAQTREETVNMTWQAVANGSNGFVYFIYYPLEGKRANPEWRSTIWPAMCAAAEEVKANEAMILSDPGPAVTEAPPELAVRTWSYGGEVRVLAVNTTPEPVKTVIRLADGRSLDFDLAPLAHSIRTAK